MRWLPWRKEVLVSGSEGQRRHPIRTVGAMRLHTTNHRANHEGDRIAYRFYRQLTVYNIGSLPGLLCRVLKHRPVADGYDSAHGGTARWVECGRCGRRPQWQGKLYPGLPLGSRYRGPWNPDGTAELLRRAADLADRYKPVLSRIPNGPWPRESGRELEVGLCIRRGLERRISLMIRTRSSGGWVLWLTVFSVFLHVRIPWLRRLSERLAPGLDNREFDLAWDEWTIRLTVWGVDGSWTRADPWWKRGVHVNLKDKLLGRAVYTTDERDHSTVIVPLPEGAYLAVANLSWSTWKRPRWPIPLVRVTASIKPLHPAPVPGKGENSYDCGDDYIGEMGCKVDPEREWKATIVSAYVNAVLRERERYAGPNWVPDAGWPTHAQRLGRVPA